MGVEGMPSEDGLVGFEGFEKRLEVEFFVPSIFTDHERRGLRTLFRTDLDLLLEAAQCTIASELKNKFFDSYVLSESSLFVYPYKIIFKTCGTTKLLKAIPLLLEHASKLSLKVKHCKYNRGTFLFPLRQPFPHGSFTEEVSFLDKYFGNLGKGSKAYVMGNATKMQNWHIYVATALSNNGCGVLEPVYTLEMCMTQLDKALASTFLQNTYTAKEMTVTSGIAKILPNSQICDFAFDPCGYSMNGVEGSALSTIHVTPEEGYSYASFEAMGYDPKMVNLQSLVDDVISCFRPTQFSLSIHATGALTCKSQAASWGKSICPSGYLCETTSREELPGEGIVVYHTFIKSSISCLAICPLPLLESVKTTPFETKKSVGRCILTASMQNPWKEVLPRGGCVGSIVSSVNQRTGTGSATGGMYEFLRKVIMQNQFDNEFYSMDIEMLLRVWKKWKSILLCVNLFYSVKYNANQVLLPLLAAPGVGFDVARELELDAVRFHGLSGSSFIFANSHIEAVNHGIHLTIFDSEVKILQPQTQNQVVEVITQITECEAGARCHQEKCNTEIEECRHILDAADKLGFNAVSIRSMNRDMYIELVECWVNDMAYKAVASIPYHHAISCPQSFPVPCQADNAADHYHSLDL